VERSEAARPTGLEPTPGLPTLFSLARGRAAGRQGRLFPRPSRANDCGHRAHGRLQRQLQQHRRRWDSQPGSHGLWPCRPDAALLLAALSLRHPCRRRGGPGGSPGGRRAGGAARAGLAGGRAYARTAAASPAQRDGGGAPLAKSRARCTSGSLDTGRDDTRWCPVGVCENPPSTHILTRLSTQLAPEDVPYVIGRGGRRIIHIQEETGASVRVVRRDNRTQFAEVAADDAGAVAAGVARVREIAQQALHHRQVVSGGDFG
jgi:hypothetical protein